MEYILNVSKIVPLTEDEKKIRESRSNRGYPLDSYPSSVGLDQNTKTIEVLTVVLTEEEYNRAKSSIINSK